MACTSPDGHSCPIEEKFDCQLDVTNSDHFPLWIEFEIDRSAEAIVRTLGLDIGHPDPFVAVADQRQLTFLPQGTGSRVFCASG